MPTRRTLPRLLATAAIGVVITVVLAACSGGGGSTEGVASIAATQDDTAADDDTAEASDKSGEEQLLDYTRCLRAQGLDVPDPEVDGNGGLRIRRGGGGGGVRVPFDRDQFDKAREVCGDPPRAAIGGFDEEDRAAFQDAALEFAKCMRGKGIKVDDPDFSAGGGPGGPGGGPDRVAGSGPRPAGRGPFGNLDRDDPKVMAALETCQKVFADAGLGRLGRGGRPGAQARD